MKIQICINIRSPFIKLEIERLASEAPSRCTAVNIMK